MKKILALGLVALLCLGATINPDQYDVLFTKCNGAGTTFVDSSTANPKTITANGNATQLPIKFNKSAGFFNGTTDYVVVPDSSDFAFETADFDIEFFFNMSVVQNSYLLDLYDHTFSISYVSGHLYCSQAGTARLDYTWTPTKNTWYHIRYQRASGVSKLYVDNTERATYTGSDSITNTALYIGRNNRYDQEYFSGWLKELRISNIARTVAVPTTQYQTDANTVLLMHFDTPATSPLGPAIAFDGTGDYLSLADSDDFFPAGNFTVECWFNSNNIGSAQALFSKVATNSVGPFFAMLSGSKIFMYASSNGSSWDILNNSVVDYTLISNKWYHVAFVRTSNTLKVYIDGVERHSVGFTGTPVNNTELFLIGNNRYENNYFNGFVREFRVSDTNRYTTAFTPSQTGFTVDANTKLYIKGNEDNGVTTFIDQTGKTVTTNGDTKIKYTEDYRSCIFKDETGKFPYPVGSAKVDFFAIGSGVGYFDGTGDNLKIDKGTDFTLGAGTFTLEQYVRFKTLPYCSTFMAISTYVDGIRFGHYQSGGYIQAYIGNTNHQFTYAPIVNKWYHIALVREGTGSNQTKVYADGTLVGSVTSSADLSSMSEDVYLGSDYDNSNDLDGLLDNIRISKGIARYTATFNPPADFVQTGSKRKKASSWWYFF